MRELKNNEVRIIDEWAASVKVGTFVEYRVFLKVTEVEDNAIIGEFIPDEEWFKMGRQGFGPVTVMTRRYAPPHRD